MEHNAGKASRIVSLFSLIAAVVGMGRHSKIFDTVVRTLSVFVVDLIRRPISVIMAPRNLVGVIVMRLRHLNLQIALHDRSGDCASVSGIPIARLGGLFPPSKNTGIWVVIKKTTNQFRAQRRSAFNRHFLSPLGRAKDYAGLPLMSTVAHNA
jgi:hypothetical protein